MSDAIVDTPAASSATAPAAPNAAGDAASGAATPAPTLLCVDDEANITSSLKRLFRPHGYRILTATGGAEGLRLFESETIDLVISDMRMPEMNGAQFLEQVRARWPDTMRILLTGYADVESTMAAINKGEIHRYISKPWDDGDMIVMVRQSLERRGLERENKRLVALTQRQNAELQALNAGLEGEVEARTAELRGARDALERSHSKLKTTFLTSIKVFSNLSELREGGQTGHSRRVADLAQRLGLTGAQIQEIMLAGLLHDIGKIGMPDALLARASGALSPEDMVVFKRHPVRGETALMPLDHLRGVAALIRAHRERFDGYGYPDGISGLAIPLGARILAVASDYDSLQQGSITGKRVAPEEARALILRASGKRYDPTVVKALLEELGTPAAATPAREATVGAADLKPGMVLTRDLISGEGVMLLAADYVLDDTLIRRIQSYAHVDSRRLALHVRLQ